MAQPGIALDRFVRDNPEEAVSRLRAVIADDEHNAEAWRLLGRALRRLGRDAEAAEAEVESVRATAYEPEMIAIGSAMVAGDLPRAEALLRGRLREQPLDVAAIRLMAELAVRVGRPRDAETLLRRALELAPGFVKARANLASLLYRQNRFPEAVAELDAVLESGEANPSSRNLMAVALGRIGDYDEALRLYEELTPAFPDHPKLWMSYGHILKTVGRQEESIAAYRQALASKPDLGEVWWSLANLKIVRFTAADVAAMETALTGDGLEHEDRLHLHFALGKAYGDAGKAANAFGHYAAGNALRKEEQGYDPAAVAAQVDGVIATLTPQFLAERAGWGDPSPDPIFILGLPRAGSTLVEQILSCHSQIEGTMELPDIPFLAAREARAQGLTAREWPVAVAALDREKLAALGAEFLERTRVQRKSGKPFYIDKLPNNWAYAGFIHLILPNAKLIDARRHPLDCCFSNFRQHFAKGQAFTYGLDDIGRYYADYVRAMDHYDCVLPGRVHRVIHERLLEDSAGEVRALLAYLGLPFEPACLEFHTSHRPVRTASSEQVRRPINRDGVGQWEPYAPWLEPLRGALGDLPETYADRPGP
ncbi:MAG TPA: sulfotransferase [Croceibacterium sp.]